MSTELLFTLSIHIHYCDRPPLFSFPRKKGLTPLLHLSPSLPMCKSRKGKSKRCRLVSLYGQYRARNSTLPPRKNIFDLPFCFPYGDRNRTIGFLNAVWKCCSILFPFSLPPVALSQGDISYPLSVSLCVAPPPTNNKDEDGKTAFLALAWGLFLRGSIWMGLRTMQEGEKASGKKSFGTLF